MSEPIREEGVWWVPRTPKKSQSSGTLVIDGDEVRLESMMGPLADRPPNAITGPEVILGRTRNGGLYSCFGTLYGDNDLTHTATGAYKVAMFHVNNLLKSAHFKKAKDARFREAAWRYSNLDLWMYDAQPIGLEEKHDAISVSKKRGERGALWNVNIGDGMSLVNDYTFSYSWRRTPAAVGFQHRDGIRIRSTKPRPFQEFFTLERRFRSLVDLLADCQLEIVSEVFRLDPSAPGEVTSVARRWAGGFAKREDSRRGLEPVSFSVICDFSAIVAKWFTDHEKLEPAANLYLYGKHNLHLDDANQFLGVMQALESFHRTFHPGTFMAEQDYSTKVAPPIYGAIPSNLAGDFRDRLKSAIRFGYEFSLARRLSELVALLPQDSVFDAVSSKKFRTRSKDTRNAFTHQIRDATNSPMEGGELYSATLRWREVLLALILQQLGLPETTVVTAAKRLKARGGTFFPL